MFTTFTAGLQGNWAILSISPVKGPTMPLAPYLAARQPSLQLSHDPPRDGWRLNGIASHVRYVERLEKTALSSVQAGLDRPQASRAALIPIRNSDHWWDLTQDERRHIFEDQSRHIAASLKYLPAVARQLYHCRDLGEPFDFLTWFEYAPRDAQLFEDLVGELRRTAEWKFVEREVDIRLERADQPPAR